MGGWIPAQTLADRLLHPVCDALLCLRRVRHVPVSPPQAAGQRSRAGGGVGGRGAGLPAHRAPHGAAPRLHGDLLLPCLTGKEHCSLKGALSGSTCHPKFRAKMSKM